MSKELDVYRKDAIEIYLLVKVDEQILTLAKATDHIYDCCDDIGFVGVALAKHMQDGDRDIKIESGNGLADYEPIRFKEIHYNELKDALAELETNFEELDDAYRFSAMDCDNGGE